jgi:GR25 family glycosyltransferase involved in LPS biosynthesis
MKFNEIPKFVINLDRRPDRMESITKEMEYLGWEFERFSAIDTNSYMGITKSTLEVIKIAKERNYPRVMIIEDDCGVMPYAKDLLQKMV